METGVVVVTHVNNAETWYRDCIDSLMPSIEAGTNVVTYTNTDQENHYEGGGMKFGFDLFDEFWLIPDTVIVKDCLMLDATLMDSGRGYAAGPAIISCVGKYRRAVYERTVADGFPLIVPNNKREAVAAEQVWSGGHYLQREDKITCLSDSFVDGPRREFRHGRENMVLESDTFIKYKGCWDPNMINDGS